MDNDSKRLDRLEAVVKAADALVDCICEFPKDPACCSEHMDGYLRLREELDNPEPDDGLTEEERAAIDVAREKWRKLLPPPKNQRITAEDLAVTITATNKRGP